MPNEAWQAFAWTVCSPAFCEAYSTQSMICSCVRVILNTLKDISLYYRSHIAWYELPRSACANTYDLTLMLLYGRAFRTLDIISMMLRPRALIFVRPYSLLTRCLLLFSRLWLLRLPLIDTEGLPDSSLNTSSWIPGIAPPLDEIFNPHDIQIAANNTMSLRDYYESICR